jgi:DNA-directed RNA polymerase specialized sigma24 family protein
MTIERCRCEKSRCLPLCPMCRKLTQLVPRIRSRLKQTAAGYGLTLKSAVLDDLTQEVLQGLARFSQTTENTSGLIKCLSRRRLIDWMKRSARRYRQESLGDHLNAITSGFELSDLALDLMQAVDRMPKSVRKVFIVHGIEERSREETAVLLDLTLAKVRKLYAVAIRIVAEMLGIDGSEKNKPNAPETRPADDIAS